MIKSIITCCLDQFFNCNFAIGMPVLANLYTAEKNIFPVISSVVESFSGSKFKFVFGDSTCVRAYTKYKRDLEDVDLIFPSDTNTQSLVSFIMNSINISRADDLVYINAPNNSGAFLRTRISIPIEYKMEPFFIVDFHIGGSVFYNSFSCEVDNVFFENTSFRTIQSVSGLEEVKIPVSKIEEVFLFKLHKFINFDRIDIISLLLDNTLDIDYIAQRSHFYNNNKLQINLNYLLTHLKTLLKTWENCHGESFKVGSLKSLESKILKIQNSL